jgi:hypothetical protein
MIMTLPPDTQEILIEGITEDGKVFRPSDWVDRLCDTLSSYGNDRRIGRKGYRGPDRRKHDALLLRPKIIDNRRCLVLNLKLRDANPLAYTFVMEFVQNNRLCWHACGPYECDPDPQAFTPSPSNIAVGDR